MAFKRYFHNNSTDATMAAAWAAALEEAIEYAGFDDLTVTESGGLIQVFNGDSVSNDNIFVSYSVSSESSITRYMDYTRNLTNVFGLYISVIATRNAVAFMGCLNDGTSNGGFVITKDTDGNYVIITNAGSAGIAYQSLDTPYIMPRGTGLTTIPYLSVSTDFTFAVTTLCNFPVPNDGSTVKYLPHVFFCITGQIQTDGDCVIDDTPYYCLGGKWYLIDT